MRIGEIADKTGLSISNIRFYEKKGLIGPDREADNKYRNYSEEDLARLKLIILYRKMDIPVETISRILTEEITVQEAVEAQLLELESKKQMIQGSIDLCNKVMEMAPNLTMISKDGKHSDTSDIESLLSYVKEEEQQGKVFGNIDELLEDFAQITVPSNLYFNRGLFP